MVTSRQETILRLIVSDYIATAAPIASDGIARKHDLGVSSATVRNDVAELEENGYITRPHTSAGSIPLDKAYRLYVESILTMETDGIPARVQKSVREQLSTLERDIDEWASVAAAVLARLVGNLAIATFPRAIEPRVKHVELIPLQDILAMLIVVLEQVGMKRQLIRLKEPSQPAELEASASRVKSQLVGLTRREIESKVTPTTPLEGEVIDATVLILREESQAIYRNHYVNGLRNLLNQPEFVENDKLGSIVEGIEDGSLAQAVLEETPEGGMVKVIIGQENRGDMLRPFSIVICEYGVPDSVVGVVSVVGPTRMEYSKTIAGVKFVSAIMNDLVEGVSGS